MSADVSIESKSVKIAVLTVSDTRTPETDTSGDILGERISTAGHIVAARQIVVDDVNLLQGAIRNWLNDDEIDVIITTGGTGLTGRDVTPSAVRPLLDKVIDGFSVVFHMISFQSIGLSTIQSRAFAGLSNGKIIFCLPGSNGAVKDGWDKIIVHQLNQNYRPCNLIELMPRFQEV